MKIFSFFYYPAGVAASELCILKIFIEFILNSIREADVTIITCDENAQSISNLGLPVKIYRHIATSNRVLLNRTQSYVDILSQLPNGDSALFLDYDMIVRDDLVPLASSNPSITFTVREHSQMPVNGGFVYIQNINGDIRNFYHNVKRAYEALSEPKYDWYGDQLAIIFALQQRGINNFTPATFDTGTFDVIFLDCNSYNYTPFDFCPASEYINHIFITPKDIDDFSRRAILHFKGPRKYLMYQYFKFKSPSINSFIVSEKRSGPLEYTDDRRDIKELSCKLSARNQQRASVLGSSEYENHIGVDWEMLDQCLFEIVTYLKSPDNSELSGCSDAEIEGFVEELSALSKKLKDIRLNVLIGKH